MARRYLVLNDQRDKAWNLADDEDLDDVLVRLGEVLTGAKRVVRVRVQDGTAKDFELMIRGDGLWSATAYEKPPGQARVLR